MRGEKTVLQSGVQVRTYVRTCPEGSACRLDYVETRFDIRLNPEHRACGRDAAPG
jgi:hypothetical protein